MNCRPGDRKHIKPCAPTEDETVCACGCTAYDEFCMEIGELNPEALARKFHETYERLAPSFGYETREQSAKPWEEGPQQNKDLMTAVCKQIIVYMAAQDPPIMDRIEMESGVSVFDGHPFVTIHTGKEKGQLTPDETREHAKHLMEVAEAAETDALLFRAFRKDDDVEVAQMVMLTLREERIKGWPERKPAPKGVD